jgi:hypothetical protein
MLSRRFAHQGLESIQLERLGQPAREPDLGGASRPSRTQPRPGAGSRLHHDIHRLTRQERKDVFDREGKARFRSLGCDSS